MVQNVPKRYELVWSKCMNTAISLWNTIQFFMAIFLCVDFFQTRSIVSGILSFLVIFQAIYWFEKREDL